MAWLREIRGMPAVSVAEGKEVGKVDALLVDVDTGTVRWLRLGKAGFFGETRVISVDAIQAVGENAVTIDSEASAIPIDEVAEAQELSQDKRRIIGNRILTNKGRSLGEIRDYEIDDDTFEIVRYEIGKSDLLGAQKLRMTADYILTIGPDAVLVDAAAEEEVLSEDVEGQEESWESQELWKAEEAEEESPEDDVFDEEGDAGWPGRVSEGQ